MNKQILKFLGFTGIVAAMAAIAWLCSYYASLHPQLLCTCSLKIAAAKCPEIGGWVAKREPWEWLPAEFIPMINSEPVSANDCVFATYEEKIVRFEPYSFHAVKGNLVEEKGEKETIYIYVWDKRYAPMVAP